MSKKTEIEIVMREKFKIPAPNNSTFNAELRLKRKGTKFYVEKSCFNGESVLHVDSFDDVTPAYELYVNTVNQYQMYLQ